MAVRSKSLLLLCIFALLSSVLIYVILEDGKTLPGDPGVVLHVLQTDPSDISLHAINENVTRSGKTGINGGFFWEGQLLSIAVNDGYPVNGKPNEYGSGWFNEKYKRGTMVYDKATKSLSVQRAASVGDLRISDASSFWAQGGVSMSLQEKSDWRSTAIEEEALPFPDDQRLRSAMVYDLQGVVYLIVSSTPCTAEQFRKAILREVGAELVDGIFLDGDGSSQLLAGKKKLEGDRRKVLQMIAIVE